ncbi:MAG: hypothetical protein CSA21_01880 [Deltaproteobacteria bacterium]|nr:MAG: hypothetical protein CSA21_01880 [Deltaproteobacteria bacterium]
MAKIKKQLRLSKHYHTCTCDEHSFVIDWTTTDIVDIHFDTPDLYIPEGRTIWFVSTCKTCRHKILHGRQLCDPRITGKRLLIEAMRAGSIHLPLRKQTGLAHKIKGLWETYNTSLDDHDILVCLVPCSPVAGSCLTG